MFIAHLPAAYLVARHIPALTKHRLWFIAGAGVPDLDMLVFIFWDAGAVHHHSYLTHRPALWVSLLAVALLARRWQVGAALSALSLGAVLHMALDSIAGQIAWGWPVTDHAAAIVEVPATRDWWVMSFLLHWTFAVELVIFATALLVWWRGVQKICTLPHPP